MCVTNFYHNTNNFLNSKYAQNLISFDWNKLLPEPVATGFTGDGYDLDEFYFRIAFPAHDILSIIFVKMVRN